MSIETAAVSKIFYSFSVDRADGEILSLGTLLHVKHHEKEAALLIARSALEKDELARMDPLGQILLANPAQFINEQINNALSEGDSSQDLLAKLSARFVWSVFIADPIQVVLSPIFAGLIGKMLDEASGSSNIALGNHLRESKDGRRSARGSKRANNSKVRAELARQDSLASIAGPEFRNTDLNSYVVPAWMVQSVKTNNVNQH